MKSTAYYNELEKYPAQWLRNLIEKGHIAPGDVDQRDIREVKPSEIENYKQAHFFAGIGTWSYALRLAGWPDDREVWTGSCPCQPFSSAGRHRGADDSRHLWPEWFRLIKECRPAVIFGEQVASQAGLEWLDIVQDDLEGSGYTIAAVDLCAAGAGAPHIRQRLYFVAYTKSGRERRLPIQSRRPLEDQSDAEWSSEAGQLGNPDSQGFQEWDERAELDKRSYPAAERLRSIGFWDDIEWLYCTDQKWRPTKPGIFPLAYGSARRMARLRAYGNAIVAPLAAEFIKAFMEVKMQFHYAAENNRPDAFNGSEKDGGEK